jgi:putative Mn2+ efflux pump MntP
MLDDLVVFGLAAFAVSGGFGEKYAKYCKIIGGVILFVLGILLLFAPQMLR